MTDQSTLHGDDGGDAEWPERIWVATAPDEPDALGIFWHLAPVAGDRESREYVPKEQADHLEATVERMNGELAAARGEQVEARQLDGREVDEGLEVLRSALHIARCQEEDEIARDLQRWVDKLMNERDMMCANYERLEQSRDHLEGERDDWKRAANGDRDGLVSNEYHVQVVRSLVAERKAIEAAEGVTRERREQILYGGDRLTTDPNDSSPSDTEKRAKAEALYPDLDFDEIEKRVKEFQACATDQDAIALALGHPNMVVGICTTDPNSPSPSGGGGEGELANGGACDDKAVSEPSELREALGELVKEVETGIDPPADLEQEDWEVSVKAALKTARAALATEEER